MAVFTVTSSGAPGEAGLTFEDAIAAANDRAGADTIEFAAGIQIVRMQDHVGIADEITINGDRDNDGISDVVIVAADDRHHLTIDAGASVTIRNVDFTGGSTAPKTYEGAERLPAATGSGGTTGTVGAASGSFMDGAHGLDDVGDGGDGVEGADGLDAVGSILNRGTLTLERVGFGQNYARGEIGQTGGNGGTGGSSSGDLVLTDGWGTLTSEGILIGVDPRFLEGLHAGGRGGDGGDAGHGGNGGNGGDGGTAAAAIMNEGTLTLTDVVFGGRLTSGALLAGNGATGGGAGAGGYGGVGGSSWGGDGGDSGVQYLPELNDSIAYEVPDDPDDEFEDTHVYVGLYTQGTAPAGQGGGGGAGGNGGDGGNGGNGGSAGTIVNRGTLTGHAAIIDIVDDDDPLTNWSGLIGDGGRAGAGVNGGFSYGGAGGTTLGAFQSAYVAPNLTFSYYDEANKPVPAFIVEIWNDLRARFGDDIPMLHGAHAFTNEGLADSGAAGAGGQRGDDGFKGLGGSAALGVLNEGTSSLESSDTIVYVHALGQDAVSGKLAFNIIRIGEVRNSVDVTWSLRGTGDNAVSVADFAAGTAMSGSATFDAVTLTEENYGNFDPNDKTLNVIRVEFEVAADVLDEAAEGFVFELQSVGPTASLGTSTAAGTIIDTMLSAPDEPIRGTRKADNLKGTGNADTILGLAGNDTMKGLDGEDILVGGAGKDKLHGGADADIFVFEKGDSGRTKSKADIIYDFTREDTLDLSGWDANTRKAGIQDFKFIGKQDFHDKAGELRFEKAKGESWLEGDTNGDGKVDLIIRFDNGFKIQAGHLDL